MYLVVLCRLIEINTCLYRSISFTIKTQIKKINNPYILVYIYISSKVLTYILIFLVKSLHIY